MIAANCDSSLSKLLDTLFSVLLVLVLNHTCSNLLDKYFLNIYYIVVGFPIGSVIKNLHANERDIGDTGLIPGSGRSPGGRNGNPL